MTLPYPRAARAAASTVRRAWPLLVTLLAATLSAPGPAAGAVVLHEVRVGFDGYYKVGSWSPVAVEFSSGSDDARAGAQVQLEVVAPDPDGYPASFVSAPVGVREGRQSLAISFMCGRLESELHVRLLDERGQRLAAQSIPATSPRARALRQDDILLLTIGSPAGFEFADGAGTPVAEGSSAIVRRIVLDSAGQLPTTPEALASLDAVAIARQYDLPAAQSEALDQWVQNGGHLFLAVGAEVESYRNGPLAGWVPVPVEGPVEFRDLSSLETFARISRRIEYRGAVPGAQLGPSAGEVLAVSGESALLVRAPHVFGRVTFLAIDLDRPPLSEWQRLGDLVRALVLPATRPLADVRPQLQRSRLAHTGINDLATQLHATQDSFPQVRRTTLWGVMGLILLYLLAIGPLDYLLVHRVLKKPHLTWITFPLMAAVAVALATWSARGANGNDRQLNQLEIVDHDVTTGQLRSTAWTTLYSPETRRYHVELGPAESAWVQPQTATTPAAELTWSGIPESAFGGMYRAAGAEFGRPGYRFAPRAASIENLPVPIWSTKSLSARWQHAVAPLVEARLESSGGGQLSGSLVHHFPVPLDEWMVAYGNRVYRSLASRRSDEILPLEPDRSWSPTGPTSYTRELRGFLTGTRAARIEGGASTRSEVLREQMPYDSLSLDQASVVRMLSFHDAAGGQTYTGLTNQGLEHLDFSRMLDMGYAVLFGRLSQSASQVRIDGTPAEPTRQATFVRVLIPVERVGSDLRRLDPVKPD